MNFVGLVGALVLLSVSALCIVPVHREETTRPGCFFYHVDTGLHYHVSERREGTWYLKCVFYERGCRGRAILDQVDGLTHTSQHTRRDLCPDRFYPDEIALRRAILQRCATLEYVSNIQILTEESHWFGPEVVARVTLSRMRTAMRNARLSQFPRPAPATLLELTALHQDPQFQVLTMTDDGLDNLYGGSVTDVLNGHHVVYMTERQLNRMREMQILHSDGTFQVVPANREFAAQVFTVIGTWNNHVIPLAWVLMSGQTEEAYTAVLQFLSQQMGVEIELNRAITDFETAEQNAWENVFGVSVQGCLGHLGRAFMDEVHRLGLIIAMREIAEVRFIIRLTLALPLLPNGLIVRGYFVVLRHARNEGNYIFRQVRPFLQYVYNYWVNRPWRRRRMTVFGSQQRTNNCCESHNKMIVDEVGVHPYIYRFILGLVQLEQRAHNAWLALETGRRPRGARRQASIMADRQIQQLGNDLLRPPGPIDNAIFRFLRAASHQMENLIHEILRRGPRQQG